MWKVLEMVFFQNRTILHKKRENGRATYERHFVKELRIENFINILKI